MTRPAIPPGTIVVALGGYALQPPGERVTIFDQFRHTRESLTAVVELARAGWRIALVHGNGPQVGDDLDRHELARERVEPLPLGVLVSGTAGWIGYMIQQSLQNALERVGVDRQVLTTITQTVIAEGDTTLEPTKPIGHVLSDEEAARHGARGIPVGRDGGGRWRRLAPSPVPVDIVGAASNRTACSLSSMDGHLTGGIPAGFVPILWCIPDCRVGAAPWECPDPTGEDLVASPSVAPHEDPALLPGR